jgi:hypothetical protein
MKLADKGVLVKRTTNLLTSKVVLASLVMSCSLSWPTVARVIETGKMTPRDVTTLLGTFGSVLGAALIRYSDDDSADPRLHTPGWMPGRNAIEVYKTLDDTFDVVVSASSKGVQ